MDHVAATVIPKHEACGEETGEYRQTKYADCAGACGYLQQACMKSEAERGNQALINCTALHRLLPVLSQARAKTLSMSWI